MPAAGTRENRRVDEPNKDSAGADGTHLWSRILAKDPEHSQRYAQRWVQLRAEGRDLDGEARLIDAMAARGSRILDAGCGTGRTGGRLAALGHRVVGVDLDPVLIEVARSDHPDAEWYVGDLADLDHCAGLADQVFDLEVSAGNVITFVAPGLRRAALGQLRDRLAPDGRLVIGFGTDRGYRVHDFFDDLDAVGLQRELLLSTWDLRPWTGAEGFMIAVLRRA